MLRPSTSRGLPALGCADKRSLVTAAIRSMVSSIGAGRTVERVTVLFGRHLRDNRQVRDAPHGVDGGANLVDVAKRLEDDEIHAALDEGLRLLAEVLPGFVDAGLAPRFDTNSQRTDRP